ncbi:hypothetical protein [Jeotgalibacillus soli]|uniref:Uncharacterized protein n=1 Tax=Jeotgalibacillus soli TaxID=889306 RepID=A0A0C2RVG2_9BACL|nr:hypothetical protein [Jeotgalibacillus soli]KIL45754.1 hypothetical protein KP78_21030 [Jeotgalibacillus soli]
MGLNKNSLKSTFDAARETDSPFVFVAIVAEGVEEVIVVPEKSFDAKEAFYNNAYNDELTHVMNSKVYIRGLGYGEATELKNIS